MAESAFKSAGHAQPLAAPTRAISEPLPATHRNLLLIVDDEPFQRLLLELAVELGLETRQETAAIDAILAYRANWTPHTILLDQLMPRTEFYSATRALRSAFGVPVLAITADAGSTDLIPEPGVLLLGRHAALAEIRRLAQNVDGVGSMLTIGALSLDRTTCTATLSGRPLRLSHDETTTLALLMQHAGTVVHRRTIVAAIGGLQRDLDPRIVDVHVVRLMVTLGLESPVAIERSQDREGYLLKPIGSAGVWSSGRAGRHESIR